MTREDNKMLPVKPAPLVTFLYIYVIALGIKYSLEASQLAKVFRMTDDLVHDRKDAFNDGIGTIYEAYKEYRGLTKRQRLELKLDPLKLLSIDFSIEPMKRVEWQVGTSKSAQERYMKRMKETLKYFWPAYKQDELPMVRPVKRIEKMRKLCKILNGVDNEQLTMKHFLDAKVEKQAWLERMKDIRRHEDIYANRGEYARIMQYLNLPDFKLIHKKLLPIVEETNSAEDLRRRFEEENKGRVNAIDICGEKRRPNQS